MQFANPIAKMNNFMPLNLLLTNNLLDFYNTAVTIYVRMKRIYISYREFKSIRLFIKNMYFRIIWQYFAWKWQLICVKDKSFSLKQITSLFHYKHIYMKAKKSFSLCQSTKCLKKINEPKKQHRNKNKKITLLPWQSEKSCKKFLL